MINKWFSKSWEQPWSEFRDNLLLTVAYSMHTCGAEMWVCRLARGVASIAHVRMFGSNILTKIKQTMSRQVRRSSEDPFYLSYSMHKVGCDIYQPDKILTGEQLHVFTPFNLPTPSVLYTRIIWNECVHLAQIQKIYDNCKSVWWSVPKQIVYVTCRGSLQSHI